MVKPVPMDVGSMDVWGSGDGKCGMSMEDQDVDAVARMGIQCYGCGKYGHYA